MKVKEITGRVWMFLRRKRNGDRPSFVSTFFRKKSGTRTTPALAEPKHRDPFEKHFDCDFPEPGPAGRISFSGQEDAEVPAVLISRGGAGALSARRMSSFNGLVLEEEEAAAGRAVSSKGGAAGQSSRRLSFSGFFQPEAGRTSTSKGAPESPPGPAYTVQQLELEQHGPAITASKGETVGRSSRRLSFSFRLSKDDQRSHSKRHMQVITLWNPASAEAATVESPTENGSKVWLRQASKRFREFGSGRRSVDAIEKGPEGLGSENDWRRKIFDIDYDRRWPVQGW